MVVNAENLRSNKNTNMDEMFMAINNKFQGSKRICRSERRSYQGRTQATALRYQLGADWSAFKWECFWMLPQQNSLKISMRRQATQQKSTASRKLRLEKHPELRARKKRGRSNLTDCTEYGEKSCKRRRSL